MIPEKFMNRMALLLGEEYESFKKELEHGSSVRAVRINTLKSKVDAFLESTTLALSEIPYADDGFILREADGIGNTPEHHAGMIYVQDPGAMSTVNAAEIKPGMWVLDMCAAPGGKSGQAAAKLCGEGFLLSNEFVPKRAKITVSNFERLGIKNAVVTSLDTKELPKLFCEAFDLIIADVPCSGEGMFRKDCADELEWSEENVELCAKRQLEILNNAPSLLKPDGHLLYSTCTYSLEENEMVIDEFLSNHPEFELVPVKEKVRTSTRDGINFANARTKNLELCRRFYPHVSPGEGQFMALLRKKGESAKMPTVLYKNKPAVPSRSEMDIIGKFIKENLISAPDAEFVKQGENIVLISHGMPIPPYSVFSSGVLLGKIEKGIISPAHHFFSAYGELFLRKEELSNSKERLDAYLHGEEITAEHISGSGWCVLTYKGASIGGGKLSSGRIKNHYPKGLRTKA